MDGLGKGLAGVISEISEVKEVKCMYEILSCVVM